MFEKNITIGVVAVIALIPALIWHYRRSKRRFIVKFLNAQCKKCETLALANTTELATLECLWADFGRRASTEDLARFTKAMEAARQECQLSGRSFQAIRESIGKLVENSRTPTNALFSLEKDYERAEEGLKAAGRVLEAAEERHAALIALAAQAERWLAAVTDTLNIAGAALGEAESRGFKLASMRSLYESLSGSHATARDRLWKAEKRLSEVVKASTRTEDALAELMVGVGLLDLHVNNLQACFDKARGRAVRAKRSLDDTIIGLSLLGVVDRSPGKKNYRSACSSASLAKQRLGEAEALINAGEAALDAKNLDVADEQFAMIEPRLDEAEAELVALQGLLPKPKQDEAVVTELPLASAHETLWHSDGPCVCR